MDEGLISVFRRDFNGGGWAVFGKGITSGTVILSRLMLTEGFCGLVGLRSQLDWPSFVIFPLANSDLATSSVSEAIRRRLRRGELGTSPASGSYPTTSFTTYSLRSFGGGEGQSMLSNCSATSSNDASLNGLVSSYEGSQRMTFGVCCKPRRSGGTPSAADGPDRTPLVAIGSTTFVLPSSTARRREGCRL